MEDKAIEQTCISGGPLMEHAGTLIDDLTRTVERAEITSKEPTEIQWIDFLRDTPLPDEDDYMAAERQG